MRLVAWNCGMALHQKFDALLRLRPDLAVVSECAEPGRLRARGLLNGNDVDPVWVGENPHKGLAVFSFNGYAARLRAPYYPALRYIAPVHVTGPVPCSLLAVWAQNFSAGITRKHQLGPLRRALTKYAAFLAGAPGVVAGDFNNNVYWHKPGWRMNHGIVVDTLARGGLVSAYHVAHGEEQGGETIPTLYWRDRRKDGPTYHIDYVFIPAAWTPRMREVRVGTFEDWCGAGMSDHAPIVVDVDV